MNGLPRLLRLLEMAAHDNDQRALGEIFEQLDRHEGWSDAVEEFIDRLPDREASVIEEFRDIAGPDFLGQGGSSSAGGAIIAPRGSYPINAGAVADAIGWGTWSAGWLCDETSGNLLAAFGSPALVPSGTPTYGNLGPLGGTDKAVGYVAAGDNFGAGDNFDALAGDLAIVAVMKVSTSTDTDIAGKGWTSNSGCALFIEGVAGGLNFWGTDGVHIPTDTAGVVPVDKWGVVIGVLDRGASSVRVAFKSLDGSSVLTGPGGNAALLGSLNAADNFTVGWAGVMGASTGLRIAAVYVANGTGAAAGLSTNIATAVANLVRNLTR